MLKNIKFYLNLENNLITEALTDLSYKNRHLKINRIKYEGNINKNLALIGDAVIKLALSTILYKRNCIEITINKSKLESDANLIKTIAKKNDFLKYLKYDIDEKKEKNTNNYDCPIHSKETNPWKYIATSVEAIFGAIYLIEEKNMQIIESILIEEFSI